MGDITKKASHKPGGKSRPSRPASGTKSGTTKVITRPTKPVVPSVESRSPFTDEEVLIPGLPSEADIEQQVGLLSPADKARFTKIRTLLARRLGSLPAARVWLTTPGRGFDGTPLDAVRGGMADLVLDVLKEQSSPNPPYA